VALKASETGQLPIEHRKPKADGRWIAMVLTGILGFALTYASAWVSLRYIIVFGDNDTQFFHLQAISESICDFFNEKGRYPDSLDELAPKGRPETSPPKNFGTRLVECYRDQYQYRKTENGFTLELLGRDGKPEGITLVGEAGDPRGNIGVERWTSRFLFEGMFSGTLFAVACGSSICAALACHLANGSRQGAPASRASLAFSVLVMSISAVVVSFFLIIMYIGFSHH
jgi:hypothetical protein